MYADKQVSSFCKVTKQVNCKSRLKTWDFFFARYFLNITSKSLSGSLGLGKLYLNFNQTSSAMAA